MTTTAYRRKLTLRSAVSRDRPAVEITPAVLLGLISAAGGIGLVPARGWPVEAAIETLREQAAAGGPVRRAAERWPTRSSVGYGCSGVDALFRRLTTVGWAKAEGSGWHAGWRLQPEWITGHLALLWSLDDADREAVDAAGQLAAEMVSRWSKKTVASRPTS